MIVRGIFICLLLLYTNLYSTPLYKEHYWLTLLHYKNGKSEIDDKKFFLAKDGKFNPKSEFKATVNALINDRNSTFCRYPARSRWILKRLPSLKEKVGEYSCKKIDTIIKEYNPKSIYLIFPTAHINSPASMYGHSFLRVDKDKNTPLISQAINYSAQTEETNGILFAYNGLVGGYEGRYSILPYYDKIKEYNDMERRDIWEYELDLTPSEINELLYHLFELKDVYANYYFFTENCSYNLLWLLEVAKEDVNLVDDFSYKAIPIDTIRAINKRGLIKSTNYRPSKSKKIKTIVKKIDNVKLAKKFLNDYNLSTIKELNSTQKAYMLDLASEMLRFKRAKNRIKKKRYIKDLMKVLGARSKIDIKSSYSVKEPPNPLSGHKTSRIWLSVSDDSYFFSYKPSFHDKYDLDSGFQEGAYINFFDLSLKKYKDKSLKIEKFDIVNITSLSAWDEFFRPISWNVVFGYSRDYKDNGGFVLKGGSGISYKKFGLLSYLFVDPALYLTRDSLVSISPKVGFIKSYKNFKFAAELKREFLSDGQEINYHEGFFTIGVKKNLSLNLKYSKIDKQSLANIGLFYYF